MSENHHRCLLMLDHAASGEWNMAVDEALLNHFPHQGFPQQGKYSNQCILRFYQWQQPTLSLGYFQKKNDRASHLESQSCPLVRRQTGGGAILHDQELTYSLIVPTDHILAKNPHQLYQAVHQSLQRTLENFQIQTRLVDAAESKTSKSQPFLCFLRRSEFDVLLTGQASSSRPASNAKICGSAQRRRQKVILQHGSVLLKTSDFAPQLLGICQLSGQHISIETLQQQWSAQLADQLEFHYESYTLSDEIAEFAAELAKNKYRSSRWNSKR